MKSFKSLILVLLIMLCLPIVVNAETRTVNTEEELINAIKDKSVDYISIGSDINTTQKITTTRDVTIDGNGHTLKYVGTFGSEKSTDNKVWGSIYILQIYKANVTIKDIKLTGGNAAILVNGGNVTLEGIVDVSGNGFGGIELGKGKDVTSTPTLNLDNDAKIVNTTDSNSSPSVWVPKDTDNALMIIDGVSKTFTAGEELTLGEINTIYGITDENPKTGDNIFITLSIIFISLITLIISYKKLLKA